MALYISDVTNNCESANDNNYSNYSIASMPMILSYSCSIIILVFSLSSLYIIMQKLSS